MGGNLIRCNDGLVEVCLHPMHSNSGSLETKLKEFLTKILEISEEKHCAKRMEFVILFASTRSLKILPNKRAVLLFFLFPGLYVSKEVTAKAANTN